MIRLSTGLGSIRHKRKTSLPIPNATTYTFNTASPSAISSYSRASTNEFYRSNTGKFVNATSNEIRYDHDFSGNPLGMRFDHISTNKCTNTNWGMTDLSGLTVSGNATATVTIEPHPVHGHPTICIDNTLGGSGTKSVTIAGATGNTNPHSMRVCARAAAGGLTGTFIGDNAGGAGKSAFDCGLTTLNTDGFIFNENFIPSTTTRTMRLNCSIGAKAYFWLNQLEEAEVCTFPLLVAGATATRTAAMSHILLSAIPTYTEAQGALVCEAVFDRIYETDQYVIQIANGNSTTETYGLYAVAGSYNQVRARTAIASGTKTNEDVHCPIRGKRFPMAFSWKNGETLYAAGPMSWSLSTYTGAPTGMNRINLAGKNGAALFAGWIRSLTILDQYQNLNQLAQYMFPAVRTYRGICLMGQSNMHGRFRTQETQQNAGEEAAVAQMDIYYPDSENWAVRGAINGSAADKSQDVGSGYTNWHYDRATAQYGPTMTYAKSVMTAFGVSRLLPVVGWNQGETDVNDTVAGIKITFKAICDELVSFIGAGTKILVAPLSRRSDFTADNYGNIKKGQREVCTENPSTVIEAPPQNDVTTNSIDGVHLTNASYVTITTNLFRKMMAVLGKTVSGAVDPPTFSSASRSGTTVTVPITFPSGITAITPTSAISGFRCFDGNPESGGTEIAVTAATYASGNVTLTIASVPAGSLYVEFARGSLYKEFLDGTLANLPKGNGTGTLGMAWNRVIAS